MASEDETKAEARFARALAETEARDPREYYRARLRELREADADAYGRAVAYYREKLIPSIASGEAEPLGAWLEFGRILATFREEGRTVVIDGTGTARPYDPPVSPDLLVLHLPDNDRVKALPVGLPFRLTPAQQATYDLLVSGKQKLTPPDKVEE